MAENIVSDVFLNFWRSGAYLSIQTTFQAYRLSAVRNRVLNYLRDRALHQPVAISFANDLPGTDAPQQILQCTEA